MAYKIPSGDSPKPLTMEEAINLLQKKADGELEVAGNLECDFDMREAAQLRRNEYLGIIQLLKKVG